VALALAVNAGSTSLKLHVVDDDGDARAVESLEDAPAGVAVVGHRVVHGGPELTAPTVLTEAALMAIRRASTLAPLHNRPALEAIEGARAALPAVPHVAVFDTAFHASIPPAAARYAVPDEWWRRGIRRYGFHGTSVRWAVSRAGELAPAARRLAVCHLGGGCSVTAVRDGRSADTTMGFTPLEGVPMATRSGTVDVAVISHLADAGMALDDILRTLERESGLLGLSGSSGRVEELEARAAGGDERAALALEVFTARVAGAVGAMAVAAGGLDALIFTGGVGEGSADVRAGVCGRLGHLGVRLADVECGEGDRDVAAPASRVRVLVVHAREELVIAADARAAVAT
jgi:acetate kinase